MGRQHKKPGYLCGVVFGSHGFFAKDTHTGLSQEHELATVSASNALRVNAVAEGPYLNKAERQRRPRANSKHKKETITKEKTCGSVEATAKQTDQNIHGRSIISESL